MIASLLLVVLLCGVFLTRAYGEVDDRFVQTWARAHALTLTPGNRPMVWWYLRNARVLRTLGVLAGIGLLPLVSLAVTGEPTPQAPFLWAFVGYLVGALYAEVSLVRPRNDGPRAASLASREVEQYLPRRLLVAQRVLVGVAVAVAVLMATVPFEETTGVETIVDKPFGFVLTATAAATAAGLRLVERWLIRRPQPFVDPDLLAADDAIRAQSVHSVAASGIAVSLALLTGPFVMLAVSEVQVLRWTMWPLAVLALPAGAACCLYYGHRAWRVPRPGGDRRVAAAP